MAAVRFYLLGVNRRPVFDAQVWQHILSQLRAALLARPDSVEVCRGNYGRFGAIEDCRALRNGVVRDPLNHVEAGIAGNILPPLAAPLRQPQPRSAAARVGPCALGCVSSAGRAHGLQSWHGMPATWGVAVGLLGPDCFAEDEVLGSLDADAVLCTKHYRYASRICGSAVLQPDAPT